MHELAVTQDILKIALHHADDNKAAQITAINLVVGQMASIVDDSVQFYWDIISTGTIAQGAALHFERIPARFSCQSCNQCYLLNESNLVCPFCGSSAVTLIAGDEFYIDSLEVEA